MRTTLNYPTKYKREIQASLHFISGANSPKVMASKEIQVVIYKIYPALRLSRNRNYIQTKRTLPVWDVF